MQASNNIKTGGAFLPIDPALYSLAEQVALRRNVNLTFYIESALKDFVKPRNNEIAIDESVYNMGLPCDIPTDYDYRKAYREHLEEKYQ